MPSPEQLEKIRHQCLSWREEAENDNRSIFRRMTKGERFKVGRQWDKDTLEYNRKHRKHSVTINNVLPIVNFLDGEQVRNPRDLTAVAYKGGSATRARLLTALMKQVCDSSHGKHQQSMAFDNGVTTARGYLGLDTSYFTDPFGDLQLCTYEPFSVLPDAHRKRYDPNDWRDGWRYVFIDEWEPKFKVETEFPNKKSDLAQAHYGGTSDVPGWFGRIVSYLFPGNEAWESQDDYRDPAQAEGSEPSKNTKWEDHYRVSTCYWREWRKGAYVRRKDMPDWFVLLTNPKDIKYARQRLEEAELTGQNVTHIELIEKDKTGKPIVVPVLMRTRFVGDVLLDHTEDPFGGIWQYPIVPFNAYFENGYEFSVVDNIIGPQEVMNWAWSMVLNVIRKVANAGWRVKTAQPASKRWLEDHGTEDGIVLDESLFGGKVEKLEPTPYPTGFHEIAGTSGIHMREIANVRTERPEFDNKNMSGVAIARKQASSDQGAALLFGNWDMTLEILGGILIEHIVRRSTYTRDEIKQMVDDEDLIDAELLLEARQNILKSSGIPPQPPLPPPAPNPQALAGMDPMAQLAVMQDYQRQQGLFQEHAKAWAEAMQMVDEFAPQMAIEMLLDELEELQKGKTRFGVKSSLSESASTFREQKFIETLELDKILREGGREGVSRELLIKASDAPYKDEMLQPAGATTAPAPVPAMAGPQP
jgi:hypothetical protein